MFPIELLGVKTNPAKSACNVSVIFDKNFTFRSHVSVICNSCFYHMQDLRRIRRHIDLDSAKLLATALVSSHFDYCNSLWYGMLAHISHTQRVAHPTTHGGSLWTSLLIVFFVLSCSWSSGLRGRHQGWASHQIMRDQWLWERRALHHWLCTGERWNMGGRCYWHQSSPPFSLVAHILSYGDYYTGLLKFSFKLLSHYSM